MKAPTPPEGSTHLSWYGNGALGRLCSEITILWYRVPGKGTNTSSEGCRNNQGCSQLQRLRWLCQAGEHPLRRG